MYSKQFFSFLSLLILVFGQSGTVAQVSQSERIGAPPVGTSANPSQPLSAHISQESKREVNMTLGICEHLWGRDKAYIDSVLDAAAKIRMRAIRWDVPWKAVELEKGRYVIPPVWDYVVDAARSRGIDSMLILGYGHPLYDGGGKPISAEGRLAFSAYAEFLAAHFRNRAKFYEIWNEWDGRTGNTAPGKILDYVELVRLVYPKIKAQSPESIVLIGALDTSSADNLIGYGTRREFEELLDSPSISLLADGISIHPYVVYRRGELREYQGFEFLLEAMVRRIRQSPGFESKPIVISELGWSTTKDERGVSESVQATNLRAAIKLAERLGVSMLFIYELLDDGNRPMDVEAGFGLMRYDWSPKASYLSLLH